MVALAEIYYQKILIKYKDVSLDTALSLTPTQGEAQLEAIDIQFIEIESTKTFRGVPLCSQMICLRLFMQTLIKKNRNPSFPRSLEMKNQLLYSFLFT
jgi:hypothetical protein